MRAPSTLRVLLLLTLFTITLPAPAAHAEWPLSGKPITQVQGDWQYPFTIASDGSGGAFFAWASTTDIATHLDREGESATGWGQGGIRFGGPSSFNIRNVADGAGACYFVFNAKDCVAHCGPDPAQRRVIRLGTDGQPPASWPGREMAVATLQGPVGFGASDAGATDAVADRRGGLLVAWGQHVGGRNDPVELRLQRIDSLGTRQWGDSGLVVQPPSATFPRAALAPDGRGGALVCWIDERPPYLFAQHVSASGRLEWSTEGVALASAPLTRLHPPLAAADGSGGAYFVWQGTVDADSGIFAVRIQGDGRLEWRRPLRVVRADGPIDEVRLVPTSSGELLVVWRDAREAGNELIRAQRIVRSGRLAWPRGLMVCGAPGHKAYVAATADALDGAYIAWGDTRPAGEVYATHLDRMGRRLPGWDRDGTAICPPVAAVWQVALASDETGGAVLAWTDERIPTSGFPYRVTQAMRLTPFGPVSGLQDAHPHQPKSLAGAGATAGLRSLGLSLRTPSLAPSPAGAAVRITLPDAGRTTLALHDIAGRRLWSREVGALGQGEHTIRLADGAWLPSGSYFARLQRGPEIATVKVVVLH